MKISIFGLGYVGCVSLGCLARNGHMVIGVDVSKTKVNQINAGLPTIIEKDIDVIIQEEHLKGTISATSDFKFAVQESEVSIVAVGTPSCVNGHLDLTYVFDVAHNIGLALKEKEDYHVVVIRSTVLPGTVAKFASIVEETSGKRRKDNFDIVSNPEF